MAADGGGGEQVDQVDLVHRAAPAGKQAVDFLVAEDAHRARLLADLGGVHDDDRVGVLDVGQQGKADGAAVDEFDLRVGVIRGFEGFDDVDADTVVSLQGIADTHQARGGGFSIGTGNLQQEVDTYSQNDYGVSYRYGRDEAKAQLGFYYLVQQVDFDARLDSNGIDLTRIRDRQTDTIGATFSYEIGAKTDLVVDLNQQELDYDVESGFGNTVDSLLVGISWDATAKTSGRLQVGTQSRDLTSGGSEDSSIWQLRLDWTPSNNSIFRLTSSKSSEASIGIGNSRDIVATNLSWIFDWNSEWQSNVTYGIEETDFIGTNIDLDNTIFTVNFEYEMNDLLTANIFFTDTSRDTNDVSNQFIFDQTVYGISINLSFL